MQTWTYYVIAGHMLKLSCHVVCMEHLSALHIFSWTAIVLAYQSLCCSLRSLLWYVSSGESNLAGDTTAVKQGIVHSCLVALLFVVWFPL